jgi:DNA-binding Lrp family transcriptional regulator
MTRDKKLDDVDLKIMRVLQQNARLEITHVATKVGRCTSATMERIEHLQEQGYIRRFTAIIDRKLVGRPTLMVALVKLKSHNIELLEEFAALIGAEPEVQVVLHLAGEFDFLLQVSVRDSADYKYFLEHKLCTLPMVDKLHSSMVIEEYKMEPALPL